MESIMQTAECCCLCGRTVGLERHHCLHGTANRRLADEDGLTVLLCHSCHRNLHDRGIGDVYLQQEAEKRWCEYYQKGKVDFIKRYGKSKL